MTAEQTLLQIRQKDNVAVLLVYPGDELCIRARQTLESQERKLTSMGFHVFTLEANLKTSGSEELACVRFPQLRFFLRGKLQHEIVGVFDAPTIDAALKALF